MKIIADENLAFTDYFFGEFANIQHKAGRLLDSTDVKDCQALLIRSVTKVTSELIEGSALEFVGSATIGTDHIDMHVLQKQHITWANAAGCNAQAVAEYVVTALLTLKPNLIHAKQDFCLGIIGLGNVGTRLAALAKRIGWKVIGYDPLVKHTDIEQVEFAILLEQANAISIHVPLTMSGPYATHHLFHAQNLAKIPANTILINSARGSVIDEQALIADIQRTQRQVVLDVFEHEPVISEQLLSLITLVTPHIAGYSLEGKARGTQMIYQAFCQKFGFNTHKSFESQLQSCPQLFSTSDFNQHIVQYLPQLYDIRQDDANLRACLNKGYVEQQAFDSLRKHYPLRREWAAYGA